MKRVQFFKTADGIQHETERQARHHAYVRYTDKVSHLAAKMVHIEKYTDMKDFIDKNLDTLASLRDLKQDMVLEQECGDEQ